MAIDLTEVVELILRLVERATKAEQERDRLKALIETGKDSSPKPPK